MAKSSSKITAQEGLPTGTAPPASDPDFNDELPGLDERTASIDPDASEFRDEIQVGSYASAGALQTELDRERQEAEQATLDALEAMRAMDAGDQVKWRISRTGHESDELNGYLETWPNHLMTIERIRDRFGGGTFYCKGFRKGRYCSHQVLQISGEAKRKPSGVEGVNGSVPTAPAGPGFDVQGFLMAQERRDERRREEERRERQEREEREEKRRQERMQMMLTLGPAAISALGGLFQGQRVDYMPLIAAMKGPDPITVMTQLKALQGNSDSAMTKILPMLIDMAGQKASSGDTGWLDVVKELAKSAGPTIGGLIEASVQQAKANAEAATAQGAVGAQGQSPVALNGPASSPQGAIIVPESRSRRERVVSVPTANPVPRPQGQVDMNMMQLLPHLPWLKDQLARMGQAAVKARSPEVYAAMFLEELPDAVDINIVAQLLAAADWYQRLCQLEPRLNREDLLPWFTALRADILQSIQQETGAVMGSHSMPTASHDSRAATRVEVQGPDAGAAPPPPAVSVPAPRQSEPSRPTKIPSLTGED